MLSSTSRPITQFGEQFLRVFGIRPDYARLTNDPSYATNVLLTAQRSSDLRLKQAAFELSTMLATGDSGQLSTAADAVHAGIRDKRRGISGIRFEADVTPMERAIVLIEETVKSYLTPFKAHALLLRLRSVADERDVDKLLGDLQGELMRSLNTESAIEVMGQVRRAIGEWKPA